MTPPHATWLLFGEDCVAGMAERLADDSIDLTVTSIPFEELFTYSGKTEDVGNNGSSVDIRAGRFALNMRFVCAELFRVTTPGRNVCVHIQQLLAYKIQHGFMGRRDFRGAMIDVFGAAGFLFTGEFVIPKDPQSMAQRLNLHSLQFKTGYGRDASLLAPAVNDYVLIFHKPGENPRKVRCLKDPKNPKGWVTKEEWIRDAHGVWSDILEIDVLDGARSSRNKEEKQEKHVCPLQLEVIRRCVALYTNPGDLVLDPFAGIGSTGWVSLGAASPCTKRRLEAARRFVGFELKESYAAIARENLAKAEKQMNQGTLFDVVTTSTIIAVDLFCGAGGTSAGLARACTAAERSLDLTAVNHWERAIETHSANHPAARHLCHGLDDVDPRKLVGRQLDLLMASPECTHHSAARGGKPCEDQSRSTAWHVVRWADALRPKYILVENVREFQTWGPLGSNKRPLKRRKGETFQAWLQAIRSLGYVVDCRLLNAADYGAATSRTRLFVIARRGRGTIPWPEPTHAKEPVRDLFGLDRPRWRAAREVIDWSLPCPSIFTRKRPLSQNTLRRIEAGLRRFGGAAAEPFLLVLRQNLDGRSLDLPVPTLTAGGEHVGLVRPFVIGQQSGAVARDTEEPLPTVAAAGAISLVEPFVMQMSQSGSNGSRLRDVEMPHPTITTADDLGLVQPFLVPTNYGERPGQAPRNHDIAEPLPTVVATGTHGVVQPFVVRYNGRSGAQSPEEPFSTLDTNDRLGLVSPDAEGLRYDIGFRMLQPQELAAAMGFPVAYHFAGNRGERVKQIGNAVEVNVAFALTSAILGALLG